MALYKFQWERAGGEDYQSVTAVLATKKIAIADDIIRGGTGMVLKCDQAHQMSDIVQRQNISVLNDNISEGGSLS